MNNLHFIKCPRLHCPSDDAPIVDYCAASTFLQPLDRKRKETDGIDNPSSIDPRLIFVSRQRGTDHFNGDTLTDNNMRQAIGALGPAKVASSMEHIS